MSVLDYDAPPWAPVESVAGQGGRVPSLLDKPLEPLERVVLAGEDGPVPGRIHFTPGHRPALHVRLAGAGQGNLVLPWQGYKACRWSDFAALAAGGSPLAEPDDWHRNPETMREALEAAQPAGAPGGGDPDPELGPLSVRCDVCGAPEGKPCRDGTGAELAPHGWRVNRALELAKAAAAAELEPTDELAHPCDSCGARPGEPCTTSSGRDTAPHAPRRALAEAARLELEGANRPDPDGDPDGGDGDPEPSGDGDPDGGDGDPDGGDGDPDGGDGESLVATPDGE